MKRSLPILLILLFFTLAAQMLPKSITVPDPLPLIKQLVPSPTSIPKSPSIITTVTKVVDGDTIEIEGGTLVRYIGIDTPETKHPTKGIQCFGKEASEKNKALVEGKQVRLKKDVSETDRYGRLLRYVYLHEPNATMSPLFINEYLVQEGYAHAVTFPPDVAFVEQLRIAEQTARNEKKGLWSRCTQN